MVSQQAPRIGVGVIITKDKKVLFGYRKSIHGLGTWSPPGGKLDYREDPIHCAIRETREEAGIEIEGCQIVEVTNDVFADGQHFVTIWVQAKWRSGNPRTMEIDKITDWQWVSWSQLPQPLFLSVQNLVNGEFSPSKL